MIYTGEIKKMKKSIKINSILLILCMLCTSIPILAYTPTAEATNAVTIYAPNYYDPRVDLPAEMAYTTQCATYIYNLFWLTGRYSWRYAGNNADVNDYITNIQIAENNYDKVAVFTKGHIAPWGNGAYYSLIANSGNTVRDAQDIFPLTKGKTAFAWIYHCGTAMSYPSTYNAAYGWSGMPYAWTRNNAMTLNGYNSYSGSQVYIGFANASPQFLEQTGYAGQDHGYFCAQTFSYLIQGYSTSDALDKASYDAFGVQYFTQTHLYNGRWVYMPAFQQSFLSFMVVYGNGRGLGIP
jgi:hypothetical protein